jgi:hypothetical protein
MATIQAHPEALPGVLRVNPELLRLRNLRARRDHLTCLGRTRDLAALDRELGRLELLALSPQLVRARRVTTPTPIGRMRARARGAGRPAARRRATTARDDGEPSDSPWGSA